MDRFGEFRRRLRPGKVYRRADLMRWSNAVDRHIRQALAAGLLVKVRGGLYYAPKPTVFGQAPAADAELVSSFLKGGDFLMTSPNAWNALGVGATQLHNRTVVYNHKRHEDVAFGGRIFEFRRKAAFPKTATPEFLLVDLVNNVERTGEDPRAVLDRVRARALAHDRAKLKRTVEKYGSERTKRVFAPILDAGAQHAG
jgi:hypothetical protein